MAQFLSFLYDTLATTAERKTGQLIPSLTPVNFVEQYRQGNSVTSFSSQVFSSKNFSELNRHVKKQFLIFPNIRGVVRIRN